MERSVFDLDLQNAQPNHQIVALLEKIAEAFRVLLWKESTKTGLISIQTQLLTFIFYQP